MLLPILKKTNMPFTKQIFDINLDKEFDFMAFSYSFNPYCTYGRQNGF